MNTMYCIVFMMYCKILLLRWDMDKIMDRFHAMVEFKGGLMGKGRVSIVIINAVTVFYLNIQYVQFKNMYMHNECIISSNLNGST